MKRSLNPLSEDLFSSEKYSSQNEENRQLEARCSVAEVTAW